MNIDTVVPGIEAEADQYLAERPEATLSFGISHLGKRVIRTLRSPQTQHVDLPDPNSIYEIGSVSKVFTTTLLAVLEGRGLLGLDDPISKHLPQLRMAPEIGSITLRQLATHSSGLANTGTVHQQIIDSEQRGTEPPFGCYTHYLRYRKEHLYADLECAELEYPTGSGWLYSVLGMGTLGHILELVAEQPFEQLLVETVCEPLGLDDIRYTLSPQQLGRVVFAYDSDGQPCPNWYHDVMLPQGGLRETIPDLLTFVEANIKASREPDDSELSTALRRTRQVHFTAPPEFRLPGTDFPLPFIQGLGWIGLPKGSTPSGWSWFHSGTTLFYNAGAALDEDSGLGFVLLASSRTGVTDSPVIDPLQSAWFRQALTHANERA